MASEGTPVRIRVESNAFESCKSLNIRDGHPVGNLIGLKDEDDWWEEVLLNSPRFKAEIAQARQSLKEGKDYQH